MSDDPFAGLTPVSENDISTAPVKSVSPQKQEVDPFAGLTPVDPKDIAKIQPDPFSGIDPVFKTNSGAIVPQYSYYDTNGDLWSDAPVTDSEGNTITPASTGNKIKFASPEYFHSPEGQAEIKSQNPGVLGTIKAVGTSLGKGVMNVARDTGTILRSNLTDDAELDKVGNAANRIAASGVEGVSYLGDLASKIPATASDMGSYLRNKVGLNSDDQDTADAIAKVHDYENAKNAFVEAHNRAPVAQGGEGQSVTGNAIKSFAPETAKFFNENVDPDTAAFLGLVINPEFVATGPFKIIRALMADGKMAEAANMARTVRESMTAEQIANMYGKGAETASIPMNGGEAAMAAQNAANATAEAAAKRLSQIQQELGPLEKEVHVGKKTGMQTLRQPTPEEEILLEQINKSVKTTEPVAATPPLASVEAPTESTPGLLSRTGSVISDIAENPSSAAMKGAGSVLRGTSQLLGKLGEGIATVPLLKHTVPAMLAAELWHETDSPTAAISALIGGELGAKYTNKLLKNSKFLDMLGDYATGVGTATETGGGVRGFSLAARQATSEGARAPLALSSGAKAIGEQPSRWSSVVGSPLAKTASFVGRNVVDPALKGAAVGAGIGLLTGQDIGDSAAAGSVYGLAGHAAARAYGGIGDDVVSTHQYINKWLETQPKDVQESLRKQDPAALATYADIDLLGRGYGMKDSDIKWVNGKDYVKEWAGTPTGRELLAHRTSLTNQLASASDVDKPSITAQLQDLDNQIVKQTTSNGYTITKAANGRPLAIINADADLRQGNAAHEIIGHVLDGLDSWTGKAGKEGTELLSPKNSNLALTFTGSSGEDETGKPFKSPGRFSNDQLIALADRYNSMLGRKTATITSPDGAVSLAPDEESRLVGELGSEANADFAARTIASGESVFERARRISQMEPEEIQADIDRHSRDGVGGSSLFKDENGQPLVNNAETEQAVSDRIVAHEGVFRERLPADFDPAGRDRVQVLRPKDFYEKVDTLYDGLKQAKATGDAATILKAIEARDDLVDQGIFKIREKGDGQKRAEAAYQAELKLGRKPTQAEIKAELPNVHPFELANQKGNSYKPGDMPIFLSKNEQEKWGQGIAKGIQGALKPVSQSDANTPEMSIVNPKDGKSYMQGLHLSDAQIAALKAIPRDKVPRSIINNIIELNQGAENREGRSFNGTYYAATRNKGNIPRTQRAFSVMGFRISKTDNALVTVLDRTRMMDALDRESQKPNSEILKPFTEPSDTSVQQAKDRFLESFDKYVDNHSQGQHGENGLDADRNAAIQKRDAINGFLGVNKDNPLNTDNAFIRSLRLDRLFNLRQSGAEDVPYRHELAKQNFQPAGDVQNAYKEKAEEAGYDTSKTWLHGTTSPRNFKTFKIGDGELGKGIYITQSPLYSDAWSRGEGGISIPLFLKKGDLFDLDSVKTSHGSENPESSLYQVKSQSSLNKVNDTYRTLAERIQNNPDLPERYQKSFGDESIQDSIDRLKTIFKNEDSRNEVLKAAGYVCAFDRNSQVPDQVVVFDPSYVKSAIGNKGSFDSNKNDIRFMPRGALSEVKPIEERKGLLSGVINKDATSSKDSIDGLDSVDRFFIRTRNPLVADHEKGYIPTVDAIRIAKKSLSPDEFKSRIEDQKNGVEDDSIGNAFAIEMAARERVNELKDRYENSTRYMPKGEAPATFLDYQSLPGMKRIALFNLTKDIEGHPKGSTVTEDTLKELGYDVPKISKPLDQSDVQKRIDELLKNKKKPLASIKPLAGVLVA